ncbi:SNPC4 protein, partial [Spelaeornis formosus]|nr:SNPC4 protein [Elachura formosa]
MSRRPAQGPELDAEREKIRREIERLERSLQPDGIPLLLSDSSLSSDAGEVLSYTTDPFQTAARLSFLLKCLQEVEIEDSSDDDDDDDDIESLPQNPETCLEMNHVYQEVIKEKIEEVELLIEQNREEQREIMLKLRGAKKDKAGDGRSLSGKSFLGHFMKPYFKDKVTGIGPPSNEDAKEKAAQGIKSFEQLHSTKWKTEEKSLLQKAVVSDRLQRLLQPKLLKLSYWNQKLENIKTEIEKQILEKQIKDLEQEIEAINQLPESDLIGNRFDEHDWDKISNIHFDGRRSSEELKKFWQNWEHPSINKNEWTDEEIERLKIIAAEHEYLHWQTIAQELETNRTPFQCLQKYQIYNKDLKRKEWTKEEDQMLLELVQEMRVGSHIPYKRIAYYMEGRDSAQLIYRWTKSVDPSLRKGPWTPKEDAMLMAAVEKYGAKEWYKIRTEVPGRSDAQCRERYLKVLHWDVKKGKWSLEEEEQLIELIRKHGLGHWSKIASDLPHRTGAQCLSKWKLMIGDKVLWKSCCKRSKATKRCHTDDSSSPSESSSEEDMELELTDSSEEERTSSRAKEKSAVPSIDLWIPTEIDTQEAARERYERYQFQSLIPAARAAAGSSHGDLPGTGYHRAAEPPSGLNTLLKGIAQPCSTDVLASQCGKEVLWVSLEDVRKILRNNTSFQRKLVSASGVFCALMLTPASFSATPAGVGHQDVRGSGRFQILARQRWRRQNLDRKLLMAVTPWVGNVLLPCTLQAGSMAFHWKRADAVHRKVGSVSLTSTPLFALLIHLLQIDTKGCMKIIKERNLRQLEQLKASARSPQQVLWFSCGFPTEVLTEISTLIVWPHSLCNAVRRPHASRTSSTAPGAPESCAPAVQSQRHKPKTVSELLREKRLRESQAKDLQRTVLVAPQLLLPGPLIIQHPPQIFPSAQAGSNLTAAAGADGQARGAPVPTRTSAAGSASALVPESHSSAVPEAGEWPGCSQGADLQSSKKLKGQASGANKLSISTPGSCEAQQRPVSLLPALVTPPASAPSSVLPLQWVVTQQTVLPCVLQAVAAPQSVPAAAGGGQCQPGVTPSSSVPALGGTPAPVAARANPPQPSRAAAKGSSSQLAGAPLGKAAEQCPVPSPVSSASPGCSTRSVATAAAPAQHPRHRPIASKPPQAHGPPQPSTSSAKKNLLDFSLISLEDEGVVKEWLSGKQGVQVPALNTRLPYLPPFLCSIRILSKLLEQKAALEEQAACLLPPEASENGGTRDVFRAIGELVQQELGDNPAYLLLKARFLAAFTLPAVLATLPPPKVKTTLSAGRTQCEDSDDEEWQSEKEVSE